MTFRFFPHWSDLEVRRPARIPWHHQSHHCFAHQCVTGSVCGLQSTAVSVCDFTPEDPHGSCNKTYEEL